MTSITTCLALGVVCVISVIYRLDSIYFLRVPAAVRYGQRCVQHDLHCYAALGRLEDQEKGPQAGLKIHTRR